MPTEATSVVVREEPTCEFGWREGRRLCLVGLDTAGAAFVLTGTRTDGELDFTVHRIAPTAHAKKTPG
ncbi:MAG: hypothetical protein V4550_20810 [Gemmatimonadota bacterium]